MLSLCAGIFGDIVANRSVGIVSLCAQKYLHIGTSRFTDVANSAYDIVCDIVHQRMISYTTSYGNIRIIRWCMVMSYVTSVLYDGVR